MTKAKYLKSVRRSRMHEQLTALALEKSKDSSN